MALIKELDIVDTRCLFFDRTFCLLVYFLKVFVSEDNECMLKLVIAQLQTLFLKPMIALTANQFKGCVLSLRLQESNSGLFSRIPTLLTLSPTPWSLKAVTTTFIDMSSNLT